jgi:hypothetical protein
MNLGPEKAVRYQTDASVAIRPAATALNAVQGVKLL